MAFGSKDSRAMIDRYSWLNIVLIYVGLFVFLFFLLSPFIEGFLVSLKPLAPVSYTHLDVYKRQVEGLDRARPD